MIEPIVLTEYGETLDGYPGSEKGDEDILTLCVGIHAVCRGWVDLRQVSTTHNAIVCRACQLRVIIPKKVQTFGDLRTHLMVLNLPILGKDVTSE